MDLSARLQLHSKVYKPDILQISFWLLQEQVQIILRQLTCFNLYGCERQTRLKEQIELLDGGLLYAIFIGYHLDRSQSSALKKREDDIKLDRNYITFRK